jgi:hypothetical protein
MKKIILSVNVKARNENSVKTNKKNQEGTAIVIALLIMILLMGFVTLAISRSTSETVAAANDAAESLEVMTKNFDKIFDLKLSPDNSDFTRIKGQKPPDFTDQYEFDQNITQTQATQTVVMTGRLFQGLNALRDEWRIDTTATDKTNNVQVALRRKFFNNRIPIFQFGIFYDDDLEFHPGPRFDFGGRVHSNGSLFMMAQTGLYFSSKVTAKGHVFTDVAKNGYSYDKWGDNVHIKNASGKYVQLKNDMGSVLQNTVNGAPRTNLPNYPVTYDNAVWSSHENKFQGNLLAYQRSLDLPLKINSKIKDQKLGYIELIRRGKSVGDVYKDETGAIKAVTAENADDLITSKERYYNKNGIRVLLADKKERLPGCATSTGAAVATDCGVRLDGHKNGGGTNPASGESRGYEPRPMQDGYQATRINGERFHTGREIWIKIESVGFNAANGTVETKDITQDILSLGVTQPAPVIVSGSTTLFGIKNYSDKDSRSVIKLQRFIFGGSKVVASDTNYITMSNWNSVDYNYVLAAKKSSSDSSPVRVDNQSFGSFLNDHQDHWKEAVVGTSSDKFWVVPFPINMFDTREGLYYEGTSVFNPTASANYGKNVPWNGVMSMVDIDVKNLKTFLDGFYDNKMPTGTPFAIAAGRTLKSTDIPDSNGWVLYVSDRRGDYDFDGEYDMEDVYGKNDGVLQPGEDINGNSILEREYINEAVRYTGSGNHVSPDIAALFEHKFYRRGVRLINGDKLPGKFDSATPENTKGFTVASENGVYVLGNYNATGIAAIGNPTKSTDYLPQDTADHIPASVVADAVTILSNNWSDARSFTFPFSLGSRKASETFTRFAMLAGDAKSSVNGEPNQGGGDPRLAGGVHNFKRFLEDWGGFRLNYAGSLINLYNSHNNNGTFKCCAMVYAPPTRNWVFDSTFLDPRRLPPGTPFFQSIQITGFQRLN